MRVFQESNFYNCIAVCYSDLAVFGTAPMLIYEDFENVIWCTNPCAGEYYVGNDQFNMARIFYREITKTVSQMKQEWPSTCSQNVNNLAKQKGTGLTQEIVVCHAIQANDGSGGINKKFPWAEFYWEKGSPNEPEFLSKRGFFEWPGIVPRWDVSGNDAYGRSPGMDALGDIKQLQQETRRKAQAIDKLANPPMVADVELKNAPASTLPGGVTYITRKDGAGFKPAYENFRPPIQELMADIMEVQKRIKTIFFNDLFLMFQELQAEPRSAAAIDARREEKLVMLGPVLERFQTEALDPAIDRTFGIMMRGGLFPEAPPEIQGRPIQVEYSSMLAAAQSAASTSAIERLFALVGNAAAIHPEVLDVPNWDKSIMEYSSRIGNDPALINTPEQIAAIREAKAQQQKLAYLTEIGQGAAK
ncbi:MAG TPA: portal protein, partial [Pirellula sp.]|nr:portal protein [Pirellula sp.]